MEWVVTEIRQWKRRDDLIEGWWNQRAEEAHRWNE